MKVFIVYASWDYEGGDIMAVCETREQAEAIIEEMKGLDLARDNHDIEEWEVGDVIGVIKCERERKKWRK